MKRKCVDENLAYLELLLALLVEIPPVLLLFLVRNVDLLVLVLVPVRPAYTQTWLSTFPRPLFGDTHFAAARRAAYLGTALAEPFRTWARRRVGSLHPGELPQSHGPIGRG